MSILRFTMPPMPNFIASEYRTMRVGEKHLSRRGFGVFDLLYVISGCLYVGEEDHEYEIRSGQALVLRPDAYHYGSKPCTEDSDYIFLHFTTLGPWVHLNEHQPQSAARSFDKQDAIYSYLETQYFKMDIPSYTQLDQPEVMKDLLTQLIEYQYRAENNYILWKQQTLFQEVLMQLASSDHQRNKPLSSRCAELAAVYLRQHYQEEITAQALGEAVNFHPVYIARCMKQQFGCSPMQYLNNYRIERAKLLLIQSDSTILRIAEEVGYQSAAYFTSSFTQYTGISPRQYRQRFR